MKNRQFWVRASLGCTIVWLFFQKEVSVQLSFSEPIAIATAAAQVSANRSQAVNVSLLGSKAAPPKKTIATSKKAATDDGNLANTYSNMTYGGTQFETKENGKARTKKERKQLAYVAEFLEIAQQEMEKYSIPASITLAQGLIESNCGDSRLAKHNNNHFGIKCFSRSCKRGHCSNFSDDTHKDFFRKYKSTWESFRAHSQLLSGKRYRHLKKLDKSNYQAWAKGLKKAGYATDPHYATKLISIIKNLDLDQYDS